MKNKFTPCIWRPAGQSEHVVILFRWVGWIFGTLTHGFDMLWLLVAFNIVDQYGFQQYAYEGLVQNWLTPRHNVLTHIC